MDWKRAKQKQMREEALEALGLSEENRNLADRYLDPGTPENELLLKEAGRQDFHALEKASLKKSTDYIIYCEKEQLKEEMGRYIRFAAAVGGSTVYYILDVPYKRLEWLSASQQAAVLAEMVAWEELLLNRGNLTLLFFIGEKNPRAIRKALKLCGRKGYNVQILLHGIYLYHVKPKGVMAGKYIRETEYAAELSGHLLDVLVNCFSLLTADGRPTEAELKQLRRFTKQSELSEKFPEEFSALFAIRRFSGYLLRLLGGAAFLSIEHSDRFQVFLRILTAMDAETVLDACLMIGGDSWFRSHMEMIEKVLPVPMEKYVEWCAQHKMGEALTRISVCHPEAVQQAAASLSAENYQYLMTKMKEENTALWQEMNLAFAGVSRIRLAGELVSHYTAGRSEAKRYLLGKAGPEAICPFVKEWRLMDLSVRRDYEGKRTEQLDRLRETPECRQMYRRAVVLEGLCLNAGYFQCFHVTGRTNGTWKGIDEEELTAILAVFEEERIQIRYQMELLEQICSYGCSSSDKKAAMEVCVRTLIRKKTAWKAWYVTGLQEGSVFCRSVCIRVLGSFGDEYKKALLSCTQDPSVQVRSTLADICTGHRTWEAEIRAMLASPAVQERELALQVLKNWGIEEDSDKTLPGTEELVTALTEGGRMKEVSWAYENMPPVHRKDGREASAEELAALLLCYADCREPGISKKASFLASGLETEELAVYMKQLLERWMEEGADSKKKWTLCAASLHGGSTVVPVFRTLVKELTKDGRRHMAAEAVKALALNESTEALTFLEQMSRKSRYPQIRETAADAFSRAAVQKGITEAELNDQMVPDLGFGGQRERVFDYGSRSFHVVLTPALTLEVCDESGKYLKQLPAPGKKDDPVRAKAAYEEFRQLKKQLKTVLEDQKHYMERVFLNGRRWKSDAWKQRFIDKAVMHLFAAGLIWGIYEDGQLIQSFRYTEDGSFITADEERCELPQNGRIGLVHPAELTEEERSAWKEQLEASEIPQPIVQLDLTESLNIL